MATEEKKYNVLVASGNDKLREFLTQVLPKKNYEVLPNISSAGEARRKFISQQCNLLVINTPLPDEFGTELAIDCSERPIGILVITEPQNFDHVCHKVEDYGIFTIAKPLSRQNAYSAIKLLSAMTTRLQKMEKANRNLQEKVVDIRVVDRAKWLLIKKEGMSEDEAHHTIERNAMDMSVSRREAAEEIIRSYEDY